jgi:hypothetical protein
MDWWITLTTRDEGMIILEVHLRDRLLTAYELLGFDNQKEAASWVQIKSRSLPPWNQNRRRALIQKVLPGPEVPEYPEAPLPKVQ